MINITFSKFVKMNGRLWEVNFRKLSQGSCMFYADTATLQGDRIQFTLQKDDSQEWRISGSNLPDWLTSAVKSIGAAADLGLSEYSPRIVNEAAHQHH